ncbi:hypothetical protein NDU88_010687 [Pleurodeles waltl]|uniref:Nuclear transcription factor Y subunit gamma n=1 Tax=Pleurodeles waltl TaxID=8319 RepID=A0AAV7R113_PLEWA|nr:hypothetical protein NDU88_010687 [Pleurodeles waltl]
MDEIHSLTVKDFRVQELPLAHIKKIMKLDEDVKMISAEAPVLFAEAAQIFITELTLRAWIHTEDNKRRTLQRNDIEMAITKFDQFDFSVDIVPRDELKPPKRQEEMRQAVTPAEPVQYYFTLAQQTTTVQVQGQQTTTTGSTILPGQIIIAQSPQGQGTPNDHAGGKRPAGTDRPSPASGSAVSRRGSDHAGYAADHHKHWGNPADTGSTKHRAATVHPLGATCIGNPGGPGPAPGTPCQCTADNTSRGPVRTAAVQSVHGWTATLPDSASDHACRPGDRTAHVHPVNPDCRRTDNTGRMNRASLRVQSENSFINTHERWQAGLPWLTTCPTFLHLIWKHS